MKALLKSAVEAASYAPGPHLILRIELYKNNIQHSSHQRNKKTYGIDSHQNRLRFLSNRSRDISRNRQNSCQNRIRNRSAAFIGEASDRGNSSVQLFSCFLINILSAASFAFISSISALWISAGFFLRQISWITAKITGIPNRVTLIAKSALAGS